MYRNVHIDLMTLSSTRHMHTYVVNLNGHGHAHIVQRRIEFEGMEVDHMVKLDLCRAFSLSLYLELAIMPTLSFFNFYSRTKSVNVYHNDVEC